MSLKRGEMPVVRRPVAAPVAGEAASSIAGVAEGAGLAHDAGNLLGALSLYSDLLAMPGVLHEEHREYATELRMLSDRSWAMINRLVNHSRSGLPAAAQTEIAVLPNVVDRCRGLLSRVAGRMVEISYGMGAFQPVRVPVEAVERILTNLVKNAAEATPWVGSISIHVEGVVEGVGEFSGSDGVGNKDDQLRRRVVMTVRDRGCGMDQAAVRRLMQAGGISSASGRGLGFRVVRELVAMSGGCLNVESQPEVGTSISAEWYAVKRTEAEIRQDEAKRIAAEMKPVLKAEAGWIAC
jgi:signal transduction histidine kinase